MDLTISVSVSVINTVVAPGSLVYSVTVTVPGGGGGV